MHHGKKSTAKSHVVQMLHLHVTVQFVNINMCYMQMHNKVYTKVVTYIYNKPCIYSYQSHRIFRWAVFGIKSHSFHMNLLMTGEDCPLRRETLHLCAQFARFGAYFLPTFYWKSHYLLPIKILLFFNYGRPIWKWVIYLAHVSPSSSPSYSPFTSFVIAGILLFWPVILNQIILQEQLDRGSFVRGQSKSGSRGQSPLVGVRGQKPPETDAFQGLKLW